MPTINPANSPAPPKADAPVAADTVTLAVVIGAHGIGGEVRLKSFADDLSAYRVFNGGALTIRSLRHGGNGAIARFDQVADRTAAEMMRGTELTVPRSALPPLGDGEYYHADLIGLPVGLADGSAIGHVVAVENFGAGDVIEIERPGTDGKPGTRFMVPMRPEAVLEWNTRGLILDPAFIG